MSDVKYSVWLSLLTVPGSKSICRLIEAFDNDAERIYQATEEEYLAIKGVTPALAKSLCDKNLKKALNTLHFCQKHHVNLLPFDHPSYPKRLRRLPDFPVLLYYRGSLPDLDNEVTIATVGTRKITEYGQQNGYVIARDLARSGVIVVSGMASGIDSVCHRGALDALGHTIAVLGCGIDVVYPKQNASLMEEIASKGTVITEYAPGTPPSGFNFPKRNRIISGLSLGTLVVEADVKSGAMITANYAKEQGRDIFAMPGNVGEMNSLGTNHLIKQGARMVTGALDILKEYELLFPQKIRTDRINPPVTTMFVENPRPAPRRTRGGYTPIIDDRTNVDERGISVARPLYSLSEFTPKEPPKPKQQTPAKKKENKKQNKENSESKAMPTNLTEEETKVFSAMPSDHGVTPDEIARKGIPVAQVLVALTTLEIKKLVVSLPGGIYMKNI